MHERAVPRRICVFVPARAVGGSMSPAGLRHRGLPADGLAAWGLWALFWLAGCLAVAVASAASGMRLPGLLHQALTAVACAWLLPVVFHKTQRLTAQRHVWQGRVAPQAAWPSARQHHRRTLWLAWSTAALPLLVLRGLARPAGEDWAFTAMVMASTLVLLAAVLGLSVLAAAAWYGAVGAAWGLVAGAGLITVLAGAGGSLASLPQAIQALAGLPMPMAVMTAAGLMTGMLACAPLATVWVGQRLGARRHEGGTHPPASRLRTLWQRTTERWRRIDGRAHSAGGLAILYQLPNTLSQPNPELHVLQAMGSGVGPLHGVRLLAMAALAALMLRGGLPHWRLLLAPGGELRRWIGPRIVFGTWAWLCGLASAMLVFAGLLGLVLPITLPWQRLPGLVFSLAVPFLSDLALAVALATWLRGRLGSPSRVLVCLLGLGGLVLAVVLAVALLIGVSPLGMVVWTRGPGHLLGQLAVTLLFTALAQRAWARADLADHLRRRVADDQDEQR